MAIVYIGMGSNLNNPRQQLIQARDGLQQVSQTRLLASSDLFQSAAMRMPDDEQPQADYMNAVVKLDTQLDPYQLLDECQKIENNQGRIRLKRWGERTLDLDILLYDDLQMEDARLCLPHPGITERNFVLYPLHQLDTALIIPGRGSCDALLQNVSTQGIQCLGVFA